MLRPSQLLALVFAVLLASPAPAATRGPLGDTLARVQALHAAGGHPIVIFDLDDTLFRVAYRTRRILRDWTNLQHPGADLRARVWALDPLKMPYSLNGTLDRAGISDPTLRKSADRYWFRDFFGKDYLETDATVPGAVVYARMLAHSGATLVYLTGRDDARARANTLLALRKAGFPDAELVMKKDPKGNDVAFKEAATNDIARQGTVVASFDNEPANCNMFRRALPDAIVACVDTSHTETAPPLAPGVALIPDFRY